MVGVAWAEGGGAEVRDLNLGKVPEGSYHMASSTLLLRGGQDYLRTKMTILGGDLAAEAVLVSFALKTMFF